MNYLVLIGIFGFIILFSFLQNYLRYRKSVNLLLKYQEYVEDPNIVFLQETHKIKNLFKKAGVKAPVHPTAIPVGMSIQHGVYSTVDNLNIRTEEVIYSIVNSFHETIGVYRDRIVNSINPLYWVEFIFFLPKFLFEYLGLSPESIIIRLFQVVYWVLGLLYAIFEVEIITILKNWLSTLFSQ